MALDKCFNALELDFSLTSVTCRLRLIGHSYITFIQSSALSQTRASPKMQHYSVAVNSIFCNKKSACIKIDFFSDVKLFADTYFQMFGGPILQFKQNVSTNKFSFSILLYNKCSNIGKRNGYK